MASDLVLQRAYSFVKEWKVKVETGKVGERQNDREFMADFYEVFGISKSVYRQGFERKLRIDGHEKRIDSLLPHLLIIEMESLGVPLVGVAGEGYEQAFGYAYALGDETPEYILACDFNKFYLKRPENGKVWQTTLDQFVDNIDMFDFLSGYEQQEQERQAVVNAKAAESISTIYRHVIATGIPKNAASLLMTRIVFCLFADDTEIFDQKGLFQKFLEGTKEDGSDLLLNIVDLFNRLNTPDSDWIGDRNGFPYINGGLFAWDIARETSNRGLRFNAETRRALIEASHLDWSVISPVIFGSMFEGALDDEKRHDLGAHFTSEKNILKIVDSLFMNDLNKEFDVARHKPVVAGQRKKALNVLHEKIAHLNFLDPACGSGNFLIIAYRELRRLEHNIIDELIQIDRLKSGKDYQVDVFTFKDNFKVEVSQFYGIEYQAYACSIARLGMWLMDHLMNLEASDMFGQLYRRIPLHMGANIVQANALQGDWFDILNQAAANPKTEVKRLDPNDLDYILGNPPFIGARKMKKDQKEDIRRVGRDITGIGNLDYVAGWLLLATKIMTEHSQIKTAFVATNSISEGVQATILGRELLVKRSLKILFAHQTFSWDNNGAKVFVVIVGFTTDSKDEARLFSYRNLREQEDPRVVDNINQYLVDAPTLIINQETKQISGATTMTVGSSPLDGGYFTFSLEEAKSAIIKDPRTASYFKLFASAVDVINGNYRAILYLHDADIGKVRDIPLIRNRIQEVRSFRLGKDRPQTRKMGEQPMEYAEDRFVHSPLLVIPKVSSSRREYLPIAIMQEDIVLSDKAFQIKDGGGELFALLSSRMHNAWLAYVGGRLKYDFSYTNTLVYNTFVIPNFTDEERHELLLGANEIKAARANHKGNSLEQLYDPDFMPEDLRKAHKRNDERVDHIYGLNGPTDKERYVRLSKMYKELKDNL